HVEEHVRFLGHVDRVDRLLAVADVVVHGSRCEGVPQVVLQALAAGVPVVATDAEGLREIPDAPILIVDREGRGLRDAVLRALKEPRDPVPIDALAPWTQGAIEKSLLRLAELETK